MEGGKGGCRPVERRFAGVLEDDGGGDGDPGALRIAEAPCRGTTCWGEQGEERRSHHGGPRGTRDSQEEGYINIKYQRVLDVLYINTILYCTNITIVPTLPCSSHELNRRHTAVDNVSNILISRTLSLLADQNET